MSRNKINFTTMNMNYLPALTPSTTFDNSFDLGNPFALGNNNFLGGGFSPSPMLYSTGGLFPMNSSNFIMPEFSTFGNFDPFGLSSMNFNLMEAMHAKQQQTMINQMWGNFMELVKNYKMPQFDFNFNFGTNGSSGGSVIPAAKYGNYNQKATDLYKGTAEDLNKHLKGVLAGKGQKLLELQEKYGVSAAMMAAIANSESTYGTSPAARNKNNVAGIMSASSNYSELATFSSVDACLESLAKNLRNNYINQGRVTVSQIHEKYCPIGASNDPTNLNVNWGRSVATLTDKYNNLA